MSDYQSLLNNIPSDWEIKSISELGTVVSGGTPSRAVTSFWQGDIPWVTPGEVSKHKSKYIQTTAEYITDSGLNNSGANLLPEGSLLVTSRATLGARVINQLPMTTNQGFKSIVFKDPNDAEYYYHFFSLLKAELERRASGTTFLEISGTEFSEMDLPVPPPIERNKINEVLDTLDTHIRETEAIIAKLQKVKQGLLHDLLTRGVDENGELRPSYEDAPELYKQSKLGWIPNEWSVTKLEDLSEHIVDCPHSTPKFCNDGYLVARTMHIKDGVFLEKEASKVSEAEFFSRNSRLEPQPDDIVFTREAPVGEAFVIPQGMKICLGQRVMVIRTKPDELDCHFLVYQLYSELMKKRFSILTAGTTTPHLNVSDVKELLILTPTLTEQKLHKDYLMSYSLRERLELDKLKKLKLKKSGLMDDLLTGKVRVTELLKQKQAS